MEMKNVLNREIEVYNKKWGRIDGINNRNGR